MKPKLERVREWYSKATSDLKVVSHEMEWDDPTTDAVCFHAQQAVEKLLKAWLICCDVDFPPTHNIEILLVACERTDSAFAQLRHVETLTPYSVDVRYADDFYMPTIEEAREAALLAREAESFVLGKFASAGVELTKEC